MPRVFVSGLGVVSPLGVGTEVFWQGLLEGLSGAAPVERFATGDLDRNVACEVKGFDPHALLPEAEVGRTGRCAQMALVAGREALAQSGLRVEDIAGPRTSVILGTTMGEANMLGELKNAWIHDGRDALEPAKLPLYGTTLLPIHLARAFGARGMVQTLPAACAAGNYAIGFAADQIRAGRADVVVTGASEVIERLQYAGFVRLGAMSPDVVRPFDAGRQGLLLGEGAGILVLESEAHLARRGGTPLAEVGGYGLACDAHHITRPHPEGIGSAHAMRRSIESSGIERERVDFINAHGTGTHANDVVEAKVIAEVFEGRPVPVTSIKGSIGHCMGAASAIEAVSCVLSIQTGMLPPTINHLETDPECPIDLVANRPREAPCDVVLNNSLAFGGYDAVLCLARPGILPEEVGSR